MLRFNVEKGVVSKPLHIFAVQHLCFLRKSIGALSGDTILRRPRAIYKK